MMYVCRTLQGIVDEEIYIFFSAHTLTDSSQAVQVRLPLVHFVLVVVAMVTILAV